MNKLDLVLWFTGAATFDCHSLVAGRKHGEAIELIWEGEWPLGGWRSAPLPTGSETERE